MDFRGELQADVLVGDAAQELARGDNLLAVGTPNDAQMAAINRMPLVGQLKPDDVFVWPIQAINSRTYAYHMWMDKSSLKNFVDGANGQHGYSYLRNHNQGEDPHGRVFAGVLRDDGAPEPVAKLPAGAVPFARDVFREQTNVLRVYEAVFMPRGLVINGHSNDHLIRNLETGVQKSNSVGFGVYSPLEPGSRIECDICGADMFRSSYDDCPHFPGLDYEAKLGQGDDAPKVVVTATARVMNAQQNEVSGVYLGAVPDTFTERALALHRGGLMSLKDARRIEDTYHLTRGRIVGDAQMIIDMGRGAVQYHGIPAWSVADNTTVQHVQQPLGETDNETGGESMQEMLARVRELLAGDTGRLAALELHKPDVDPLAAMVKVFEAEVDDERARAEQALATHAAYQTAEGAWLGLAEGETVAQGRARKDGMAELGAKMFGRMVGDYLTQRTRAGLPADEAAKAVAGQYTPDQLEAETKALKAAADKLYGPAGRVTEPTLENRPENEATAPAPRRRTMTRV